MTGSSGQIPIRPMAPNPRTAERPMAFTGSEYFRGLLWTLLIFNLIYTPVTLLVSLASVSFTGGGTAVTESQLHQWGSLIQVGFVVAMYTVPVSLAVGFTFGGGAAYGLGHLLRTQRRLWVHRIVYLAFGVGMGALMTVGPVLISGANFMQSEMLVSVFIAVLVSVWAGWEITSRRALRGDALGPAKVAVLGRFALKGDAVDDGAVEDAAVDAAAIDAAAIGGESTDSGDRSE